jgi:hypothetical protein
MADWRFPANVRLLSFFPVTRSYLSALMELQRIGYGRNIEHVQGTGCRLCQNCQANAGQDWFQDAFGGSAVVDRCP